jgi:hypothetical protein
VQARRIQEHHQLQHTHPETIVKQQMRPKYVLIHIIEHLWNETSIILHDSCVISCISDGIAGPAFPMRRTRRTHFAQWKMGPRQKTVCHSKSTHRGSLPFSVSMCSASHAEPEKHWQEQTLGQWLADYTLRGRSLIGRPGNGDDSGLHSVRESEQRGAHPCNPSLGKGQ